MQLKRISLIVLICALGLLAVGFGLPFVLQYTADYAPTDIIGGADAPTYRFLQENFLKGLPIVLIIFGISLVLSSGFCLLFSKTVMKHCSIRTSAISLGLSCAGGAGLVCALIWVSVTAFGEASKHPIAYPVSIAGGLTCLMAFLALIVFYFKTRQEKCTVTGVVIDVLTSIVYLPAFFWLFSWLYEILS